jgi:hypothetical protein
MRELSTSRRSLRTGRLSLVSGTVRARTLELFDKGIAHTAWRAEKMGLGMRDWARSLVPPRMMA